MTGIALLAFTATGLLLLAAAFQLALSAGAPWAAAAFGGRLARPGGRLPAKYRVVSLVTAVALIAVAWLLLLRGGVVEAPLLAGSAVAVGVWAVAVLFALNTVGNLAGRHPVERWGMGSLTAALTVLCVLLAVEG